MKVRSPQLEDGHIRIANELFDAILRAKLKYSTQTVLLAVMRKTYGYGKKEDDVSASQIGALCGMSRPHVTNALNELAAMNIITKRPGRYGSLIGVNKDYSSWKDSTNLVQVYESRTSTESVQVYENGTLASTNLVQVDSTNLVHTKDNLPKDNIQKTCASANAFLRFWSAYPKKKSKVQAEKAFRKINPNEQLLEAMLAAIGRATTSDEWQKSDGKYIPYPASWLNGRRWEDDEQTAGEWWVDAGFDTAFDAENHGCNQYTAHQWKNRNRMEATA